MDIDLIKQLTQPANTKIILLVMDGLGGLPDAASGKTELETADTPHLDALARQGICGLHQPIGPGITPGSGPSHLALFSYDPVQYQVGRGVLCALGVGFDLQPDDVAARGNFCTVDEHGTVTDRRAGRIDTETNSRLCEQLGHIKLPDAKLFIHPVKEHRFLFVLRGQQLSGNIADTDPQQTGKPPHAPQTSDPKSRKAAGLVSHFVDQAGQVLHEHAPANMVLLRGFAQRPQWPTFKEVFGLNAAAIAGYPMYRGVAKLLGMDILQTEPDIDSELETLVNAWADYDFFYFHVKKSDSAGEDGDFAQKVQVIEQVDSIIPEFQKLKPDVFVVTGDHSTPVTMQAHSWHPVPVLLSAERCRADDVRHFSERACLHGAIGPGVAAVDLMPLMLAHAGRLEKFGA